MQKGSKITRPEKLIKVIFLDIDGVLNNRKTFEKYRKSIIWDKECIDRLNKITRITGAKIVISSMWRIYDEHTHAYENRMGIEGNIIGETPNLFWQIKDTCRGDEIQLWLDKNPYVSKFIILDDDNDMGHLLPHLIQTDTHIGLTNEETEIVIARLK